MSRWFRRTDAGVAVEFDRSEAAVLHSTAKMILSMIEPPEPQDELASMVGIGEHRETPEDPVLARLFPDGYADDAEAAGEFRRYTEDGLREEKRAGAQTILADVPDGGGRIDLDQERALVWLKSLNDVRLALGTNLDIDENGRPGANAAVEAYLIYDWLTGLQDSLVRALN
jgi:hypothetical protein